MSTSASHIRIVALGDSLTVGFQSYEILDALETATPYTDVLNDHIRADFASSSLSVEVVNKGVIGELTEQMLDRFKSDVIRLSAEVVIVLGGSNDLGWGLTPMEIFLNLREMYELSLKHGIAPIACTVPSILGYDAGIAPRVALNKLIQEHCWKTGLSCVDLFRATADQETARLATRYSSDGLHLNAEGYRRIGETVYQEALKSVLETMMKRMT